MSGRISPVELKHVGDRARGGARRVSVLSGCESMSDGPPEFVAIERDDYLARYVGHTADGFQFNRRMKRPVRVPTMREDIAGAPQEGHLVALHLGCPAHPKHPAPERVPYDAYDAH